MFAWKCCAILSEVSYYVDQFSSLHCLLSVHVRACALHCSKREYTKQQCREGKLNHISPDDPIKVLCLLLFAYSSVYSPITAELYCNWNSEMFPGCHACFYWMYEKFPMHNAANNFHSILFACANVCNIFYLAICRYRPSVISQLCFLYWAFSSFYFHLHFAGR